MRNGKRDIRHILKKINNHESLAGVDLRNLYLSYIDLSRLDLRGVNFEGCRLSCGRMDRSDLTNANLADAILIKTSFKEADLTGTVFRGAVVVGADFSGVRGLDGPLKKYLKLKGAMGL